jgi:hypothetical protein
MPQRGRALSHEVRDKYGWVAKCEGYQDPDGDSEQSVGAEDLEVHEQDGKLA